MRKKAVVLRGTHFIISVLTGRVRTSNTNRIICIHMTALMEASHSLYQWRIGENGGDSVIGCQISNCLKAAVMEAKAV